MVCKHHLLLSNRFSTTIHPRHLPYFNANKKQPGSPPTNPKNESRNGNSSRRRWHHCRPQRLYQPHQRPMSPRPQSKSITAYHSSHSNTPLAHPYPPNHNYAPGSLYNAFRSTPLPHCTHAQRWRPIHARHLRHRTPAPASRIRFR